MLYHNYLTHPDDVHVMREGVKAAIAVSETQALKQFGSRYHSKPLPNCKHLPHMTDEYWECVGKLNVLNDLKKSFYFHIKKNEVNERNFIKILKFQ